MFISLICHLGGDRWLRAGSGKVQVTPESELLMLFASLGNSFSVS